MSHRGSCRYPFVIFDQSSDALWHLGHLGYPLWDSSFRPASIQFPPGHHVMWSGQYEYLERATARLKIVIPVTPLIIFLLL